jgi:amino acid permease
MKLAKIIVLSLAAAFLIIGIHQTITLGFEVSYWIFMLTISMYLFYRLIDSTEKGPKKKKAKSAKPSKTKKSKKKEQMTMNRQAKRHMERMK